MIDIDSNGYICFDKFWTLLEKKKLNKNYLRNNGIAASTIDKMIHNQSISTNALGKLCYLVNCQPKDIMEYKLIEKGGE